MADWRKVMFSDESTFRLVTVANPGGGPGACPPPLEMLKV